MKYRDLESKKRYSKQYVIPSLEKNGFLDRAEKINACAQFIKTATCDSCYTTHFDGTYSCHDRLCPVCAKKRTLAWSIKLVPMLIELLKRGYHLNMLTFTLRVTKTDTLEYCLNCLYDAWRYMTHDNKQFRKEFNSLILGGVRSLEVKIGERKLEDGTFESTDCWHAHFHVLVCTHGTVPYPYLQSRINHMWNKSLNNLSHLVDVNSFGGVRVDSIKCSNETSLLKSILEVFKYITKFDWSCERVKELVEGLDGVRGLNAFGNFRYFLHEAEIAKLMDKSLTELEDRICVVCGNNSFVFADMYDTGNLLVQDFETTKFEFLSALSRFNEID